MGRASPALLSLLLALLVGHGAGRLAGRLAGSLALTAATLLHAAFQACRSNRLNVFHFSSPPTCDTAFIILQASVFCKNDLHKHLPVYPAY